MNRNLQDNIEAAYRHKLLDVTKLYVGKAVEDEEGKEKRFVSYDSRDISHDYFLIRENGNLTLSFPEGDPLQVIPLAEEIEMLEMSRLVFDLQDLPPRFAIELRKKRYVKTDEGYVKMKRGETD